VDRIAAVADAGASAAIVQEELARRRLERLLREGPGNAGDAVLDARAGCSEQGNDAGGRDADARLHEEGERLVEDSLEEGAVEQRELRPIGRRAPATRAFAIATAATASSP
jgi:hypothetical protein